MVVLEFCRRMRFSLIITNDISPCRSSASHALPTIRARAPAPQHPRGCRILKHRPTQQPSMVKQLPPPSVAASWPKPNYVDPITRGPELQIICTLLIVAVIVVLALRTWVRSKIIHAMGADDWLILAALVRKILHSTIRRLTRPATCSGFVWSMHGQRRKWLGQASMGPATTIVSIVRVDLVADPTRLHHHHGPHQKLNSGRFSPPHTLRVYALGDIWDPRHCRPVGHILELCDHL
jgi:hypothetical protein